VLEILGRDSPAKRTVGRTSLTAPLFDKSDICTRTRPELCIDFWEVLCQMMDNNKKGVAYFPR